MVKVKFEDANVHKKTLNDQTEQVIFKDINEACTSQERQEVNTKVLTLPLQLSRRRNERMF